MKALPFLTLCLAATLTACGTSTQQAVPTPTPKPAAPALEKPLYTAERGTIIEQLEVTGRVSAVKQEDLSFSEGGFVQTIYIERSDVITEGQLLAELDLGDLPNQLSQAQLEFDQATKSLARAEETRSFAIRRAELDYQDAQAQVAKLQEPATAEELAAAQAAVDQANAALDATRTNSSAQKSQAEVALQEASQQLTLVQTEIQPALRKWEELQYSPNDRGWQAAHDDYIAATTRLEAAEADVTKAQIALDAARQNEVSSVQQAEAALTTSRARLAELSKGPTSSELADARRAMQRASLALEEARRASDPELTKRRDVAQLDIDRIQASIDARRLYAPFGGEVAAVNMRPGATIAAYESVLRVLDPSALEVLVDQLSVSRDTQLGTGMQAGMVFARFQSSVITGTLERLPTSITSSTSTVNTDTGYHITFDQSGLALEIGDLADVTFILSQRDDAIWLPPQAIRTFEGRNFVVVRDGDRQRRQDIKVGITTDDRVEILSGLEAGEVVVGQ